MRHLFIFFLILAAVLIKPFPAFANDQVVLALQQYIYSARTGFKDFKVLNSREVTEDRDYIYDCKLRLPASISSRIWVYSDHDNAPRLSCVIFRAESDAIKSKQQYEKLKEAISAAIPKNWKTTEEKQEKRTTFEAQRVDSDPMISLVWRVSGTNPKNDIRIDITAPNTDDAKNGGDLPLTASESIVLVNSDMKVNWHTGADNPTVEFSLPYKNVSDKPIHCTIQVVSAHKPRDADDDDDSEMEIKFRKTFDLNLQPGQSGTVTGTLQWYRRSDTMPVIRYPNGSKQSRVFLKADFVESH